MQPDTSYLFRIRGVELVPDERVKALFCPENGLVAEPSQEGRLLVATNLRLMSMLDSGTTQTRDIFAIESVSGITVRNDVQRGLSWKQWAALLAGGVAVYVALAYWLVDRLPQIIIPVINMHAFALAIMILVILAGWLFWRGFTQPGGALIRIYGANWNVEVASSAHYGDLMGFARSVLSMQSQNLRPNRSRGAAEGQ